MRIVAGKYKHRLIDWPNDEIHTRPTKDRIREALFSALGDICDLTVLDLYAGSGSLGIEALSRGAKFCYFVDIAKIALKTIEHNLSSIGIPSNDFKIIAKKDVEAIDIIDKSLDLVLLDPPYAEGKYYEIIELLNKKLSKNAIIVCESDHSLSFDEKYYSKIKEYRYGKIFVTILWR